MVGEWYREIEKTRDRVIKGQRERELFWDRYSSVDREREMEGNEG